LNMLSLIATSTLAAPGGNFNNLAGLQGISDSSGILGGNWQAAMANAKHNGATGAIPHAVTPKTPGTYTTPPINPLGGKGPGYGKGPGHVFTPEDFAGMDLSNLGLDFGAGAGVPRFNAAASKPTASRPSTYHPPVNKPPVNKPPVNKPPANHPGKVAGGPLAKGTGAPAKGTGAQPAVQPANARNAKEKKKDEHPFAIFKPLIIMAIVLAVVLGGTAVGFNRIWPDAPIRLPQDEADCDRGTGCGTELQMMPSIDGEELLEDVHEDIEAVGSRGRGAQEKMDSNLLDGGEGRSDGQRHI